MKSGLEIIQNPEEHDHDHDQDHDEEHGLVDLPECLQHQILSNLPPKTMLIFRCVSKRWNSFISPSFIAQSYIAAAAAAKTSSSSSSSSSTTLPWTLLSGRSNFDPNSTYHSHTPLDRLFLSTDFAHDRLAFSIFNSYFRRLDACYYAHCGAVSSSNGLVLCHNGKGYDIIYAICNPITMQWIRVPYKKFAKSTCTAEAFVTRVDELTSKVVGYKVIRIQYKYCRSPCTKHEFDMEIYDSDVNKWIVSTLCLSSSDSFHFNSRKRAVCLNDVVHWEGNHEDGSNCILAYSHSENRYRLLKLPYDYSSIPGKSTGYTTLFEVCRGKLQYAKVFNKRDCLAIWVLENYDEGVFELKHTILYDEIATYYRTTFICDVLEPLAFHPFDSSIVYMYVRGHAKVLSYNIETRTLAILPLTMHEPSFPYVLPLWPPIVDRSLLAE